MTTDNPTPTPYTEWSEIRTFNHGPVFRRCDGCGRTEQINAIDRTEERA